MKKREEQTIFESPGKAFFYAIRPFRVRFSFMIVFIVLGNVLSNLSPYFLKIIADKISTSTEALLFSDFAPVLLGLTVVMVLQELSFRTGHFIENTMVVRSFDRITTFLFQTLINRPTAYFEEKFSGELSRRVEQVGSGVRFFIVDLAWEIGWPAIGIIMSAILLYNSNIWLAVVFLAWLAIFLTLSLVLLRIQYKYSQKTSEKHAALSGTLVDIFSNVSLVQAFAAQDHELKHYRKYMDDAVVTEERGLWNFLFNKFQQGMSIVTLTISLIVTSVILYVQGSITVGDFVIVAAVIPSFSGIIWTIGEMAIKTVRQYGEMKSSLHALDSSVDHIRSGNKEIQVSSGSITFEDISFAYPNSTGGVLEDFNLAILPGQKVGLVGRSGAGKSTIVKLLLRSYNPARGKILVDNQDVTKNTLRSLRKSISFVPQDTALFNRTLFENILYARPDATDAEVIEASKKAYAHDFISEYPHKYDTLVGERGVKLSGGQRQRIALARAILKNSSILVLDEATSALDGESEEIIQLALQELFKNKTVLAIAHRLSTLRAMDRIIVLENGKIVEDGNPSDLLLQEKSMFKEMWEQQKKGFI